MTCYVLVHGGWSGGWAFNRTVADLEAAGRHALVVQLKGLGARRDELAPDITLSDHIEDVCTQVAEAGIDRFVLVAHSYGGAVISGVATRLGARIDAMVYIDAFVLGDGQSLWDVAAEFEHRHYIDSQKFTPGLIPPITGEDADEFGYQPLLTMIEGIRFTGEEAKVPRRIHIVATQWRESPFHRFHHELKGDPAWEVHRADSGHNVMKDWQAPLREILLDCA